MDNPDWKGLLAEAEEGVEVLNDVVLNQVPVRFGDSDERTRLVNDRVRRDATCCPRD